jgi:anaerobic selenocysteine-containing dehydrogenase
MTHDPQPTACILCSRNCGLEVVVEDGHIKKVRGDKDHPISTGYICQKAARLEHYQDNLDRLDSPLRRRENGTFERISWDVAIREIADRLLVMRKAHGGRAFAMYGGGGQGNHLGGAFSDQLMSAMRSKYKYNALAQEKTGDFWVNGKLFGKQNCHITEDIERSDYVLFIGTNPWQAHGIRNARDTLKELSKDSSRTMAVIDPRRTETADLADIHLQLNPGTDAFLLSAMIAMLIKEDLVDQAFLAKRTVGFESLKKHFTSISIPDYVARAGVPLDDFERLVRGFASAKSACVRVDLGIQQNLNSTLCSYLEKLIFILTGNLGKAGGNNFHSFLLPLIGHSDESESNWKTTTTKMGAISKIYPPNLLPLEIDSPRQDRIRGLFVDSANPVSSAADTQAYKKAFAKLELLVVVDVAMSETAELAHYVLPASTQFEKWEATFFNLDFPDNGFHLRRPILKPKSGTLSEPEIYRRLLVAMGEIPERFPVLERIAKLHVKMPSLRLLQAGIAAKVATQPRFKNYGAALLTESLGKTLPEGAKIAAILWYGTQLLARRHTEAVRRTGLSGSANQLAEGLFKRIMNSPSGTLVTRHKYEETWNFIRHSDGRIHLMIDELIEELSDLPAQVPPEGLVLIAGERRAYNANTILRNPNWRKQDRKGTMRMHTEDAQRYNLEDGGRARVSTARGALEVEVSIDDTIRPGAVTLPNGHGMKYTDDDGERRVHGPALNVLTDSAHRDAVAATPFHKYVEVQVERLD